LILIFELDSSCSGEAEEVPVLKTKKDKTSYAAGVETARSLRRQEVELDMELVIRGIRDASRGEKLLLTDEDLHAIINAYQADVRQKQIEMKYKQAKVAEDNKKEGEAFLSRNKLNEGVVTLPSGLQYKVLKQGEGKKPTEVDTVEVHYRGTFVNGTEFDNSYARGKPVTMTLKPVIPGWREALKLMPEGSKWQLFIPPELAYGPRGSGRIPPNSTLIFEVELIAVK
jgi:FKBP-type peptidyl-prolyl cis-trans isomerase